MVDEDEPGGYCCPPPLTEGSPNRSGRRSLRGSGACDGGDDEAPDHDGAAAGPPPGLFLPISLKSHPPPAPPPVPPPPFLLFPRFPSPRPRWFRSKGYPGPPRLLPPLPCDEKLRSVVGVGVEVDNDEEEEEDPVTRHRDDKGRRLVTLQGVGLVVAAESRRAADNCRFAEPITKGPLAATLPLTPRRSADKSPPADAAMVSSSRCRCRCRGSGAADCEREQEHEQSQRET